MTRSVVIGGGFGGIAAALRLRARGDDVVLLDRCERLGGRAQVFEHGGYRHDAGPTVITAPFLLRELFALFGRDLDDYVELVPLDPWYRFRFADGMAFDYGASLEHTLAQIEAIEPRDVEGYRCLVDDARRLYEVGFTGLADRPFHRFGFMLRQLPALARLRADRSVWGMVRRRLHSDKLRRAFSIQPLLLGGNPFDTTSIYGLIHYLERAHGVHFAMGGTGGLIDGLSRLMDEVGIDINTETTVERIDVDGARVAGVTTSAREHLAADLVVANVDPFHLYGHLLPQSATRWSARLKHRYSKPSMGLFVLFFGTARQYPEIAHHTIWLGERYKGLLDDIFHRGVLPEDFSIYLHRPTATDPSFAPAGHDSFYALVPVPNLAADIDWSREAPRLRDRIVAALERTILPELSSHIRSDFYMTPHDFAERYLASAGSGFSVSPLFRQSAWFRFHNRGEGPAHLYLVGAGTHPGAGVPGVISSARVLDELLDTEAGTAVESPA
jgi:phytoene desaturase